MATRILLKTTIGAIENDWNVRRFSLLAEHLRSLTDPSGSPLYEMVARNRAENAAGDDVDLAELAEGAYDQLWLIATDVTGALTAFDVEHISRFRTQGGGTLLSRDHQPQGDCLLHRFPATVHRLASGSRTAASRDDRDDDRHGSAL